MAVTAKALREKRAERIKAARAIVDKAETEKRDQTPEERSQWTVIMGGTGADGAKVVGEVEKLLAQINEVEALEGLEIDLTRPAGRSDGPGKEGRGTDGNGDPLPAEPKNHEIEGRLGWNHFGEFAFNVRQHALAKAEGRTQNPYGERLAVSQRAAQGMGIVIGADGGFLAPPTFMMKIMERVYSQAGLLAMCDSYDIAGNSIVLPRNSETSRVNGSRSGGVASYWLSEGGSGTISKPGFGRLQLSLNKLMCLGAMTDELLADSEGVAADQYLQRAFSNELNFRAQDALVNGTGAGQPLGVLNSDCTVSVTKEAGQSAATINATNVLKMWSRMWAPCRQKAVWLINQDVEPQLNSMQIGTGVANQLTYMPPGGMSQAPYATLMGRPVVPVEYCATLGTVGDIILVDFSQWVVAKKAGGPQPAVSAHLYFNTDEMAYRLVFRIDAQPWWAAALTPYKGSNTQSCAVTLATRA